MRLRLAQIHRSGAADGESMVWSDADDMWVPGPGGGGGSATTLDHTSQWWTLTASGAQTKTLLHEPVGALVVSLNGLVQRLSQEFTVSGAVVSVLSGMGAETGDVLQVTYHYDAATEPAGESLTSTVTVVDD
jgi:hypothetical protein